MNINIKLVPKCSKGEYGTCEVVSKNKIQIEISEAKNTDRNEYFVTLLHELLHAWIFVMKANGVELPIKREHKWIYSVQAVVIEALKYLDKGKSK